LGGVGVAATGGNFILGQSNNAGNTTALSSGVTTGPTLSLTNTGGKPAARFSADSGVQPFSVGSATKVANLNADKLDGFDSSYFLPKTGKAADADKLDGVDSSGFVQGRGTALANRIVFVPTNTKALLTIPGLGGLYATCASTDAYILWANDLAGNVDVWHDFGNSHFDGQIVGPGGGLAIVSRSSNTYGGTLALGVGNDPNARRTALLHVFTYQSGDGAPCGFQVQGTLWTSQ
jgi:hypothetical protein